MKCLFVCVLKLMVGKLLLFAFRIKEKQIDTSLKDHHLLLHAFQDSSLIDFRQLELSSQLEVLHQGVKKHPQVYECSPSRAG